MDSYIDRRLRTFNLTVKPFVSSDSLNGMIYDIERVFSSNDGRFREEYHSFFLEDPIDRPVYSTILLKTKMNAGELLLKINEDYKKIKLGVELGPFFTRFCVDDNSPRDVLEQIKQNSSRYIQPNGKKKPRGLSGRGVYPSSLKPSL